MRQFFDGRAKTYRKQALGFAFFLGWVYFSFFSCGLVPIIRVIRSSERTWMWVGLLLAVVSVVVMLLSTRRQLTNSKTFGCLAALFATTGTVVIWVSHLNDATFQIGPIVGGMIAGIGFAMMGQVWGNRMSRYDEAAIEFAAPASFILAFFIYFLLLVPKGPFAMIINAALPILSMVFAFRAAGQTDESSADCRIGGKALRRSLVSIITLCLLFGLLWSQFAYFRLLSTPNVISDRFLHYLVPFSGSFVLSIIGLLSCIKLSRYLNFTLMFRWGLPLMLLSYALLYVSYDDSLRRIVSYTVNFIGMFGVQFSFWIAAPKYVRRTGTPAYALFGGMLAAEGIGIFAGTWYGLTVIDGMTSQNVMNESLLFFVALLLVAMVVGFNPRWSFSRLGRSWHATANEDDTESEASLTNGIDALFEQQAQELREAYGLSRRETEVAALLLAGRSRPYIRDELVISLNTVHSHASSIYTKCGVHTQQEFMDLLRPRTNHG